MELMRLFFGVEIITPWPEELPEGRVLEEKDRHMTLAFLGEVDYQKLEKELSSFPKPDFKLGFVGQFDRCQFLPERRPRVVAWHIDLFDQAQRFLSFQHALVDWLKGLGYEIKEHKGGFLPHVTICRYPFVVNDWKKVFSELPVIVKDIHLFESLGHSKYRSCWKYPLLAPFDEIDHTADIAFTVRGENLKQLHLNAQVALAFYFPPLLSYFSGIIDIEKLDDIIIDLNNIISRADQDIGCPYKAVSFHGDIQEEDHLLKWEMIIDV